MDFPSFHCALVSLFVSFVLPCYTPPGDFLLPIGQLFFRLLSCNLLQGASALKAGESFRVEGDGWGWDWTYWGYSGAGLLLFLDL